MTTVHIAAEGVNAMGEHGCPRAWCGAERNAENTVVLAARYANCRKCHALRRAQLPDMIRAQVEKAAKNRLRRKHAKDLARLRAGITGSARGSYLKSRTG